MVLILVAGARGSAEELYATDLTTLTLEELMEVEISSVSRKTQRIGDAAAAVFVISGEEIRRSGATTIPEVLRMVPGVQVGRIDVNRWGVTARGLNGEFANKLLVLLDGRSLYTPLFAGVQWDMADTLLEDVDRIEVIRGPGATLWGANAVNGVINIITKDAADTQGTLAAAGAGTEERFFGRLRQGGRIGEDLFFRVYAKYFDRALDLDDMGGQTSDRWRGLRTGTRVDWSPGDRDDSLTLLGDLFVGQFAGILTRSSLAPPHTESFQGEADLSGGNLIGRWEHTVSPGFDLMAQVYYDRTERDSYFYREIRNTFDVDLHSRLEIGTRQEVVWGLGYRLSRDDIRNSFNITFDPDHSEDHLFSAFVQDEITVVRDRLNLIVGSKMEHNDYTGFEVQPSCRLIWTPGSWHSLWGAVSRAVRTPARFGTDSIIVLGVDPPFTGMNPSPFLAETVMRGDRGLESEALLAFELGYRARPAEKVSVDVALFYNEYKDLRTFEFRIDEFTFETDEAPAYLVTPFVHDNKMTGETYGVEVAVEWRPTDWWRLLGAYTYMQVQLHPDEDGMDFFSEPAEGGTPRHQVSLRSMTDLPGNVELDLWGRYVDSLPALRVGKYLTLDARLSWSPLESLELSVVGRNLLEDRHTEFISEMNIMTQDPVAIERSVYGQVSWRF